MSFPSVDLATADPLAVDAICRETGFVSITGHGVSKTLVEETWRLAREFFELPLEEKMRVAMPEPGYPYGYAPSEGETLAQSLGHETPPDLKESFSIGPESSWSAGAQWPTLWPKRPRELEAVFRRYFEEMGALAARIMSLFARALALPGGYFDPFIDRHASALRALNYPALSAPPESGQLRAGEHSDYGSLTILLAEPGSSGLEIRTPSGTWQPVPAERGAFTVNVGDLLARWSNDRWVSTVHRVRPDKPRRQSIAFFHLPNWDASIACVPGEAPKYAPVIAGEHLMAKFNKAVKK